MNSPPEPSSPTYSTPTESPPPEEANFQSQSTAQLAQLANQIEASLSGGAASTGGGASSKRRQPHGVSSRDRDPKARKREPRPSGSIPSGPEAGRKEKDEPVDMHIVERLRKEIGDPFLDLES